MPTTMLSAHVRRALLTAGPFVLLLFFLAVLDFNLSKASDVMFSKDAMECSYVWLMLAAWSSPTFGESSLLRSMYATNKFRLTSNDRVRSIMNCSVSTSSRS